jgi:hypothetical protein
MPSPPCAVGGVDVVDGVGGFSLCTVQRMPASIAVGYQARRCAPVMSVIRSAAVGWRSGRAGPGA